jgi:hypothetical protein
MNAGAAIPAIVAMLAVFATVPGCTSRAPTRGATLPTQPAKPPSSSSVPPLPPPSSAPADPIPARLGGGARGGAGASTQCLAQIESFAERHSGNRVMLGQAAFADGDRLVLTRMPRRNQDGTPLDGRAALPAPLVLGLRLGPEGCTIHVVEAGRPAGGAASTAAPATDAPDSALLPGCTCVSLAR